MTLPGTLGPLSYPYSELPRLQMTPAEIAIGLQLARRGQLLEPDNTFFDWMAARFLFAARRDNEAVKTLIAASHKTDFDMHWRELIAGGFTALERVQPLLAEEKMTILNGLTLPHLSTLRHISAMTLWAAMQREMAGDAAGALEIEGALARLQKVSFDKRFFTVEKMVAGSGIYAAWSANSTIRWARVLNVGKPKLKALSSRKLYLDRYFNSFVTYTEALNRPDLTKEATLMKPHLLNFWQKQDSQQNPEDALYRSSGGPSTYLHLAWWAATLAVWQGVAAVALLLLSIIVGPVLPPRGEKVSPVRNAAISSAVVVGGILSVVAMAVGGLLLVIDWGIPAFFCGMSDSRYACHTLILGLVAITGPIIAGGVCSFAAAARRFKGATQPGPDYKESLQAVGIDAETATFFAEFWRFQGVFCFRVLPVSTVIIGLFYGLALLGLQAPIGFGGTWIYVVEPIYPIEALNYGLPAAFAIYMLSVLARLRFGLSPARKATIFAGVFAFRRVLAWTIPLSLWFLLTALVVGHFYRVRYDRQITAFIASEHKT
ncbi:hypothetical protein EON80_05285 [bacterium]|nr:MAG: hypothetical protein EON80_05285 [bacterium]